MHSGRVVFHLTYPAEILPPASFASTCVFPSQPRLPSRSWTGHVQEVVGNWLAGRLAFWRPRVLPLGAGCAKAWKSVTRPLNSERRRSEQKPPAGSKSTQNCHPRHAESRLARCVGSWQQVLLQTTVEATSECNVSVQSTRSPSSGNGVPGTNSSHLAPQRKWCKGQFARAPCKR